MKKTLLPMVAVMAIFSGSQVNATIYTDAAADLNVSPGDNLSGFTFLDITSVEVNNTATDLIFKLNLTGDPVATDWGKYTIGFDTTAGGAVTGNGWSRPINMSSGMDYWVGSWVDSGNGAELYAYTGSWGLTEATYNGPPNNDISISKNSSSVTITTPFANLGLIIGNSFTFDVFTTAGGGSDSAVDALSDPSVSITTWGGPYTSGSTLSYTLTPVPEPSQLAFLGLGAAALGGYLFRRRS